MIYPTLLRSADASCCCSLQTTHQDAIASLQAEMQQAKEAHEALQQQLADQQAAAAQQQEQMYALQATLADVQAHLGESTQQQSMQKILSLAVVHCHASSYTPSARASSTGWHLHHFICPVAEVVMACCCPRLPPCKNR
jgi:hypothetical protein